ncbi:MAG: hypothetical protein GF368_03365 [Candidatus Aenigmarchaeota archaeon]|nr:hypothetical protein [Candidatus Aenigmarchaeota archaeon]
MARNGTKTYPIKLGNITHDGGNPKKPTAIATNIPFNHDMNLPTIEENEPKLLGGEPGAEKAAEIKNIVKITEKTKVFFILNLWIFTYLKINSRDNFTN